MFAPGLRIVDGRVRVEHSCLDADDVCVYRGEYVAGAGIRSATNDLILDLKKEPCRKGKPDWIYKEWAIEDCARMFRRALDLARLEGTTLVPVPPSKRRGHPHYDDRMVRVVEKVCEGTRLDRRELVVSTRSRETRHGAGGKPRTHELRRCLAVSVACSSPAPKEVLLFDDVLTSGATFKACKMVLR